MKKITNFINNFLNADKSVQIRAIALLVALVSLVSETVFKKKIVLNPETILTYVIDAAVIVTSFINWWKDNPITPEAKESNKFMKALKQTNYEEVEDEFITEDEG